MWKAGVQTTCAQEAARGPSWLTSLHARAWVPLSAGRPGALPPPNAAHVRGAMGVLCAHMTDPPKPWPLDSGELPRAALLVLCGPRAGTPEAGAGPLVPPCTSPPSPKP